MAGGRPTIFTEELFNTMLDRIAIGESVRAICEDEDMPCQWTFYKWLREKDGLSQKYTQAKDEGALVMAEDMLAIADDARNDWMERLDSEGQETGSYQLNGEHVQRSRLRIETRKWLLSKLMPKKYGDRVALEHDVGEGMKEMISTLNSGKQRSAKREKPQS